jgi:hypothetical protein
MSTRYIEVTTGSHVFPISSIMKIKEELQNGCRFSYGDCDFDDEVDDIITFDGRYYYDKKTDIYYYHVTNPERRYILEQISQKVLCNKYLPHKI